jgi:hypothetical protein
MPGTAFVRVYDSVQEILRRNGELGVPLANVPPPRFAQDDSTPIAIDGVPHRSRMPRTRPAAKTLFEPWPTGRGTHDFGQSVAVLMDE